jgi:hypothetical protein
MDMNVLHLDGQHRNLRSCEGTEIEEVAITSDLAPAVAGCE